MERTNLHTAPNFNPRTLRKNNRLRPLTSTIHSNGGYLPSAAMENLQEETMQLKKKICYLSEENVILSTKVRKQETELRRKENEIQALLQAQKEGFSPFTRDGNALLVNSLRQRVVRLEQVLRDKEDEVHKLKSNIRSTRLQEAQIEIETLYQEIQRLQSITHRNSSDMSLAQLWMPEEERESSAESRYLDGQQLKRTYKGMNPRSQVHDHRGKTGKIQVPQLPQLREESDDSSGEGEVARLRETVKQLEANLLVKENQLNQMSMQLESCMAELEARNVKPELVDEMLSPILFSPRPSERRERKDSLPQKDDKSDEIFAKVNEARSGQVPVDELNVLIKIQAAKLIAEALCAHLARVKHLELLCEKHFDIETTSLVASKAAVPQTQCQNLPDVKITTLEDDVISDDDSVQICALDSSSSLIDNLSARSDDDLNVAKGNAA